MANDAPCHFAPKELKDPRNVDNFRGIYMPYWVYNITHEGTVQLPAEKATGKVTIL